LPLSEVFHLIFFGLIKEEHLVVVALVPLYTGSSDLFFLFYLLGKVLLIYLLLVPFVPPSLFLAWLRPWRVALVSFDVWTSQLIIPFLDVTVLVKADLV